MRRGTNGRHKKPPFTPGFGRHQLESGVGFALERPVVPLDFVFAAGVGIADVNARDCTEIELEVVGFGKVDKVLTELRPFLEVGLRNGCSAFRGRSCLVLEAVGFCERSSLLGETAFRDVDPEVSV